MKRRIIATLLLFSLIFGLCACGRERGDQEEADLSSNDLVAGWQPAQIKLPDVLGQVEYITLCKDLIYIAGRASNGPTIGYFDTINEKWYTLDFDHGGLSSDAHILSCSAANGAVWMLIEDFVPDITGREYCIFYWNSLEDASAICMPVGFEAAETRGDAQGTYRFFSGCVALDDQKAILYDTETCYVIDPAVSVLASFPLEENDFSSYQRIDGKLLISGHGSGESFCRFFDQETLQFGERIDFDFHSGRYESENGDWFFTEDNAFYQFDAESRESERLFSWADVALNSDIFSGKNAVETSAGDIYYAVPGSSSLIKIHSAMIKRRTVIKLGTFNSMLTNNIVYFNNTNPDYKIEIVKLSFDEGSNRDRTMIELATGNNIDILDVSLLPSTALDSGLLADLMPFIDNDPELSREDFIQPVLNSMLTNGALYSIEPRVNILTMVTSSETYPGASQWRLSYFSDQVSSHIDKQAIFPQYMDRDAMLSLFALYSTGAYIDWETGTCSFNCDGFKQWLSLIRNVYDAPINTDARTVLSVPTIDVAFHSGFMLRQWLGDWDYQYAGFPDSEGNGSYFVRQGVQTSDFSGAQGDYARFGIMASSRHKEAAWEYIKLLLLEPTGEVGLDRGIPVLSSTFERILEKSITENAPAYSGVSNDEYGYFYRSDADKLRELVYSTEKMAHDDKQLLDIIMTEANNYFNGYKTLDDAVAQIQSRASIYIAEQYG